MTSPQEPKQERSRATHARLLRAGAELLEEKSFDDVTIQESVARAGSSVGAFYARFRDKEGLLEALRAAFEADAEGEARRELGSKDWSQVPLENAAAQFVTALLQERLSRFGEIAGEMAMIQRPVVNHVPPPGGHLLDHSG